MCTDQYHQPRQGLAIKSPPDGGMSAGDSDHDAAGGPVRLLGACVNTPSQATEVQWLTMVVSIFAPLSLLTIRVWHESCELVAENRTAGTAVFVFRYSADGLPRRKTEAVGWGDISEYYEEALASLGIRVYHMGFLCCKQFKHSNRRQYRGRLQHHTYWTIRIYRKL